MSGDVQEADGIGRRELAKRVGTAVAGAGAIGVGGSRVAPRYSPVGRARAVAPLVAAGVVLTAYVAGVAHERYATSDPDVGSALAFEDHLSIYNQAREIHEVTDETLMASIERDAEGLKSKATEQAIIDLYQEVAEGGDETSATATAEDAINSVFTEPLKDVATRVNSIVNGVMVEAKNLGVLESYNESNDNYAEISAEGGVTTDVDYTMPNGDTYEITAAFTDDTGIGVMQFDPFELDSDDFDYNELMITEPDPADYNLGENDEVDVEDFDLSTVDGKQTLVEHDRYKTVIDKIETARQDVLDQVSNLVQNHFTAVEAGDLSMQDMLAPQAIDETINNAETWGEIALYFRQLGLAEATSPGVVEIDASDVDEIESDTVELRGKLGWTITTEVQNAELPVGASIDPAAYPGEFRMAAEYDDADGETYADMVSLTDPFTIKKIDSGEDVLTFEERKVATADTDPEEAKKIFEENREAEDQARELTVKVANEGGGGGGGVAEAVDNLIEAAANAAVYGVLLLVAAGAAIAGAKQVGSN